MMFCPKCGSLMKPDGDEWVCESCGYHSGINQEEEMVIVEKAHEKETIVLADEDKNLTLDPYVVCPKCGNRGASWIMMQTRSADEPETRIYTCVKCGYRWREY